MTIKYSDFIEQGRRNALHHGRFDYWPGGVGPYTSGHTALMMVYGDNGPVVCNVTASITDHPTDNNGTYVYKIEVVTPDASMTGDEYVHTFYKLEGWDFAPFVGRIATFSFWVRSSVAGTYSCFFRNSGADRSYIAEFTIEQANNWEKKEITLVFDYSGGTWDYGTGLGLSIGFAPACGTTYATSSIGQWLSGNLIASSNQVSNWAATAGNTFQIAQMQLELGRIATPFDCPPATIRQRSIFRYYQVLGLSHGVATNVTTGTAAYYYWYRFQTRMRVTPTVTVANAQIWAPHLGWANCTSVTMTGQLNNYNNLAIMYNTNNSGYTIGYSALTSGTWTHDARL